jgi:hypothetical protein
VSHVLRWEAPAPSKTGLAGPRPRPSLYDLIADELRARPQEWGVIFEGTSKSATAIANQLRRGVLGGFLPREDWEIASRTHYDDGVIHARYTGGTK